MDPTIVERILQERKISFALTDRDLNVVQVGGAVRAFHDGDPTCVGRPLLDLVPELVGSEALLADILAGKLPRLQLMWINRETADGRTYYLTLAEVPYRDQKGQIAGLLHLVQDVTEMGLLEQQLAQQRNELRLLRDQLALHNVELAVANAELQRLDELKSQFVSIAAHELRTPLSSVIGYVEILLDENTGPLTEGQREYLAIIQRSGRRLLTAARNLLDVTRIEAGRVDLVLQPAELSILVQRVASELRPMLEAKGQCLTLHVLPGLPPALCDKVRAPQIISNLLSNASKYTPDGGLITVTVAPAEEEGFLQVSVADNGVGISADDQAKLFSRFFRAGTASLTGASGAGLGLHITQSLVELHGGRIWFESGLGEGSTFYVTFAIADRPPCPQASPL
jgi:signal transduction histidine kinase